VDVCAGCASNYIVIARDGPGVLECWRVAKGSALHAWPVYSIDALDLMMSMSLRRESLRVHTETERGLSSGIVSA
jgi:hypothetical protein